MSHNRLANETSPYLLQHRDNPVHWWAWGPDALAEAQTSGKPILLSIGYAACHWCHVMAHESFEDEATADIMNEHFVNIKVDREERPDVDQIYMAALHYFGEQGGWPLTMFLDSDGQPFFGGTYFPKQANYGRPAFKDVLQNVSRVYHDDTEKIRHNTRVITEALGARSKEKSPFALSDTLLSDLTQRMSRAVDRDHGGIMGAPKFPQWSFFWLLWRGGIRFNNDDAQTAVTNTMLHICQGGIYDHLGGGFARYSVDEAWLVPHFEKMLYDNALMIDLLTEVYLETHDPLFRIRIEETLSWLEREMIGEGGGFAASLDADSEGEEGKFYVWKRAEILDILGKDDGQAFCALYDISEYGNWEGVNIPNRLQTLELRPTDVEARFRHLADRLMDVREQRPRPGWDDKILADWNGLMIAAIARASVIFDRSAWLDMAKTAFMCIQENLQSEGRLHHAYRSGKISAPATANDYANMVWAAIRLHQATLDDQYLEAAKQWTDQLEKHYWDPDRSAYAISADDTDDVIVRMVTGQDEATPNANGMMVRNLCALATLTGEERFQSKAQALFDAFSGDAGANLVAFGSLLAGAYDLQSPQLIVIIGAELEGGQALKSVLCNIALPGALTYICNESMHTLTAPALAGKQAIDGKATAYVCIGPKCSLPIIKGDDLKEHLLKARAAASTAAES